MFQPEGSVQQRAGSGLMNTEATRNHSELFRGECFRLIQEADKTCKRMQCEDNKQLDQHVKDIQFFRKELELKLEEIIVEVDALIELQSRVKKAQEACKEPLRVTELCLEERNKRYPSERVHDEVEIELLKEKEIMQGVVSLLQHVGEQITEQIRLNRSAKYQLERDLKEKLESECIDNACASMITHSLKNLQGSKNIQTALPSYSVTPKQWEKISDNNIVKAEQQKSSSMSLRSLVESVLQQTAADVQRQVETTTAAFRLNVQEIKNIKSRLEDELDKIQSEASSQQKTRDDLQVAIAENQHFLSLARAKLGLRHQRPAKELCHDPAQFQLLAEVRQLSTQINKLHEAVAQSEEEQRALFRCQQELQENIEIKTNSIYIDEVNCGQHREPIVINNF